jgi:hypothetical protein
VTTVACVVFDVGVTAVLIVLTFPLKLMGREKTINLSRRRRNRVVDKPLVKVAEA